jgi:hypothetical protein
MDGGGDCVISLAAYRFGRGRNQMKLARDPDRHGCQYAESQDSIQVQCFRALAASF